MDLMANEGIEYEIYPLDQPNAPVARWIVPGRKQPAYLEQINGNGSGNFFIAKNDPKYSADPSMLDARNVCKVKVDGTAIGAFLLGQSEGTIISGGEGAEQGYKVIGEGLKAWFDDANVYPHGGLKPESGDNRYFNFASTERGDWYDDSKWITPYFLGRVLTGGHRSWRNAPDKWPERARHAQWVWGSPLQEQMPYQPCYFRWEVGIAQAGLYAIYIAADDQFILYVDGEQIAKSDEKNSAWMEASRIEVTLSQGNHTIGVIAQNRNAPGYFGPAGLAMALQQVGFDGNERYIGVTDGRDGVLRVLPYPTEVPGWSVGEVVLTLLAEAEARGIKFPSYLTPTFTTTHDSYGQPWEDKSEWGFAVGESYASVLTAIEELYDVWIDPDLNLHIVPTRGENHTLTGERPIKFQIGKHLRAASDTARGKMKNALALKTTEGWAEAVENSSVGKYGRLEASMETKANRSVSAKIAGITLSQRAVEEEGATYDIIPSEYVPWVDFKPGDWVLAPNRRGETVPRRVMSISVEESDAGAPNYTIEFDTIFQDNEERVERILNKLGGSGVGGSSGTGSGIVPGGGGGVITLPPTNSTPAVTPNAPEGLEVVSEGYWAPNGITAYSELLFDWLPVTQNTNGTETVVAHYELWGHDNSTPEAGWDILGRYTENVATLTNFTPDEEWEFRVRAVNEDGQVSLWSPTVVHRPEGPNTPMIAPSKPTLESGLGLLIVRWDGRMADTSAAPPQFRYTYVEVKASSATTGWTRMGQAIQRGGGQSQIPGLVSGSSYDVRLIAVDGVGILSAVSEIASIVISGINLGSLDQDVRDAIDAAEQAALDAGEAALDARDVAEAAWEFSDTALADSSEALAKVNKSVVRVLDEYVVTNSPNVPPPADASWSPDTPDWGPGEYVWRRSKNTLVDGTVEYSSPVMITGIDGRVTVSTAVPTAANGTGKPVGSMWFRKSGSNFIGVWEWDGSAWQSRTLTDATIANLNAGKINAGTLNADRIAANSLGVQKLLVTSFDNLLQDPSFEFNTAQAWALTSPATNGTVNSRSGTRALQVPSHTAAYVAAKQTAPFAVQGGDQLRVGVWVKIGTGTPTTGAIELRMRYSTLQSMANSQTSVVAVSPPDLGAEYDYVGDEWTVPESAKFAQMEIVSRDVTAGKIYQIDDAEIFKMYQGELIVDGTIQGVKIAAEAILAQHLSASSVGTEHLQAYAVVAESIATESIFGRHLGFEVIEGQHVKAGTLEVNHVSPTFGNELVLEGNVSIVSAREAAQNAQDSAHQVASDVATMQTYYSFGPDGAIISSPGSVFATAVRNDRIEMLENGNVISYWNSGQMYVNQLIGQRVTLGRHQIEQFDANGTVVRAL